MSNYIIQDTTLADIANAIRSKTGLTGLMTPLEMPNEIESIGTGGGGLPPDTPKPIIPWVRPSNYPDLDSIIIDNTANEIYLTVDKTLSTEETELSFSNFSTMGQTRLSVGHLENGVFVEDKPLTTGKIQFSEIEDNVFLVRLTIDTRGGLIYISNGGVTIGESLYNINSILSQFTYSNCTNIKRIKLIGKHDATMSYMFQNCSSLHSIDLSSFNASNITNMRYMFGNCSSLQSIDLSNINTSNVTDMNSMFDNCYSLQSLDLSSFDTSNVTNMSYMFSDCYSLHSINLSSFNTSNVTDMNSMFDNCYSLQSLDLSSFNASNVTNMNSMFYRCYLLQSLDLSSFNTSNVTDMNSMFYGCYSLQSLDLSLFNISNVTNMSSMFSSCPSLSYVKFPTAWKAITMGSSTTFGYGFYRSSFLDFVNALPETSTAITYSFESAVKYRLTDEDIAIAQNKGYTITF